MLGKTLGPYRIESELGSGGMGKVYLAARDEDRFALKLVHPHLLESPGFFKRFLREAEIGKAVRHPNVVRCFDCDQLVVDGTAHAFLVMEYVEGQTLRDLLDELVTVPEELCRHIGREVSKGLAAIHDVGVVHRDLKPENILITPEHEIKVMDLGVARLADEAIRLSRSGAFVGSVLYASPEHFKGRGEDLDGRADLFSLGVILYELACGTHPHSGDGFAGVLAKVVHERPRRLGERNPQVSAFFEEMVHALLAKEREKRFSSAGKLLEALTRGEKSTWWGRRAQTLRAETKRPLRRIRIPRETAVYGREEELGKLRSLYEQSKHGDGQVILIEGEAGIGKTRLVDELIGRLQHDGEDLNFLFGSYPPGGAATAAGAWSTAYREQFGAEGLEETLPDYLAVTPILVPAFAALLRGEPPPEGKEPLTKDSIQTVFVHATRALAKERTTVVLIEDLHFAPEEGRALFASLALAVPGHRILLVGTARPGIPQDWWANMEILEHASRVELSRLGPKDLAHLLNDAFQSDHLAEALGFKIGEKSDGNPFFVFEIIRGLRDGQFISRGPDGTWVTTNVIQDIEIPSSVQDLIQARLADLDEEEQEMLDVAACCGFEFDPELVADVLGIGAVPGLRALGHLEKSHRLVRSVGRNCAFDHHQVQESLHAGLSERLRERYHAAIGEELVARHPEPDGAAAVDICEHSLRGSQGEKALPHLDAALDHLEQGYQSEQLVALAERALSKPGLLVAKARLMVVLRTAACLRLLVRREEERSALDEALLLSDVTEEPSLCAKARVQLGWHLVETSDHAAARESLEEALDLLRRAKGNDIEAKAQNALGTLCVSEGRYGAAERHYVKCLALARQSGDANRLAGTTINLGLLLMYQGRLQEARTLLEGGLALALECGNKEFSANARLNIGNLLMHQGRNAEAQTSLRAGLAIYREIGHRIGEARIAASLGSASLKEGRCEAAMLSYRTALALAREIGDRPGEASVMGNLGSVYLDLGQADEARGHYERSLALWREIDHAHGEGNVLFGLAMLAQQAGKIGEARRLLGDCLTLRRKLGERDLISETQLAIADIEVEQGQTESARSRGCGSGEGGERPPADPSCEHECRPATRRRFEGSPRRLGGTRPARGLGLEYRSRVSCLEADGRPHPSRRSSPPPLSPPRPRPGRVPRVDAHERAAVPGHHDGVGGGAGGELR